MHRGVGRSCAEGRAHADDACCEALSIVFAIHVITRRCLCDMVERWDQADTL